MENTCWIGNSIEILLPWLYLEMKGTIMKICGSWNKQETFIIISFDNLTLVHA